MSRNGKVVIAMSGGVDSSVAACLLREQGYDCVGVFMRVGAEPVATAACGLESSDMGADSDGSCGPGAGSGAATAAPRRLKHGCCSATDALDARAVAGKLRIPFYALNFQPDFERIIDYFIDEYRRARTPNPCVQCNIHLKFGKLLRYADALDAEFVATGHYARVLRAGERGPSSDSDSANAKSVAPPANSPRLARAVNLAKDQSYVLFGIRREALSRCLFPLGEIADKADVRRLAAALGLRVHDKPDSQEICFVPGHDYRRLLQRRAPATLRPGDIRDAAGRVLGRHEGVAAYTVGQRHGLRLAVGLPVYVTHLDAATNTVTVGARDALLAAGLVVENVNWLVDPPAVGAFVRAAIKIRHMHAAAPGVLSPTADGTVAARFDTPQSAVTPGQAAVFYAGDIVLGGGWIRSASA